MKKLLLVLITLALLGGIPDNVSAKTAKYNINVYKKITVQKGSKVKLFQPNAGKAEWRVDKKTASITKRGVFRARKAGKVKAIVKTKNGKQRVCVITVKKKIVKANKKNVYTKNVVANEDTISFTVNNKSDECLTLVMPIITLEYNDKGVWKSEMKKTTDVLTGVNPHFIVLPKSKIKCTFSIKDYMLTHKYYRVPFEKVYAGSGFEKPLKIYVAAYFQK